MGSFSVKFFMAALVFSVGSALRAAAAVGVDVVSAAQADQSVLDIAPAEAAGSSSGPRCFGATADLREVASLLNNSETMAQIGPSYLLLKSNRATQIDCAYGNGTLTSTSRLTLASSTKALTGMLAKILDHGGHLDLDAAPYELDPDPAWLDGFWPQVTLRQLLTHTSGTWVSEESETTEWRNCNIDLAEAARRIRERGFEPMQTPGGQFYYSFTGLQIAAHLMSQTMEENYVSLMERYLFDPMALDSASMWCRQNPSAGGGATMNAADYVRFLETYLPASQVAKTVFGSRPFLAVRDLISNQIGSVQIVNSPYFYLIGEQAAQMGYGLGLWIEVPDQNGRAIRFTVPGSRRTLPWADSSCGLAAILVAENEGVGLERIYPVYQQILEILNRQLGCTGPIEPAIPRPAPLA